MRSILDINKDLFRWKVEAYPAFISALAEGMVNNPDAVWPKSELCFIGSELFWWSNWSSVDKAGRLYIEKHTCDDKSDFSANFYHSYRRALKIADQEMIYINGLDLSSLDDKSFVKTCRDFFRTISYKFGRVVIVPELVAYAASRWLEEKLETGGYKPSPKELSVLTSFPDSSFMQKEEEDLLRLVLEKNDKTKRRLLKDHFKKYFWLFNGYHGEKNLGYKFFSQRLSAYVSLNQVKSRLRYLESRPGKLNGNFTKLVAKYNLPDDIISMAKLSQKAAYLQDQRKTRMWPLISYTSLIYQELAHRLNIDYGSALYLLWWEIPGIFKDKGSLESIKKKLSFRRQQFHLYTSNGHLRISQNQNVHKLEEFLEDKYSDLTSDLHGMVAYAGRARGKVKIVKRLSDLTSFKEGEILVTQMTSPHHIMAMKKSKAIVTDDGGLTSHAAVLARELKKPCVVGTRSASRILHNGDEIEVDADKGVVSILKKH